MDSVLQPSEDELSPDHAETHPLNNISHYRAAPPQYAENTLRGVREAAHNVWTNASSEAEDMIANFVRKIEELERKLEEQTARTAPEQEEGGPADIGGSSAEIEGTRMEIVMSLMERMEKVEKRLDERDRVRFFLPQIKFSSSPLLTSPHPSQS